jgi:hypothetical protein
MTDIKLIIVEHLIKMHKEIWDSINNDESDDRRMDFTHSEKCKTIISALKEIAISEQ